MTDRVKGFVVALDRDLREDDAEGIADAIRRLRHVGVVEPVKVEPAIQIERMRMRMEALKEVGLLIHKLTGSG